MCGGCIITALYVKQIQNKTKAVSKSMNKRERKSVTEGERETRRERKIREGWEETLYSEIGSISSPARRSKAF